MHWYEFVGFDRLPYAYSEIPRTSDCRKVILLCSRFVSRSNMALGLELEARCTGDKIEGGIGISETSNRIPERAWPVLLSKDVETQVARLQPRYSPTLVESLC